MTKPINEPTPALEAANYGWRIRQLERRPDNDLPTAFVSGTKADFQVAGFSQFYDDGTGTFETNDPVLFTQAVSTDPYFTAERGGVYVGCMYLQYNLSHGAGGGGPGAALNRAIVGEVVIDMGVDGMGFSPLRLDEFWWSDAHQYVLNGNTYSGEFARTGMWCLPDSSAPFLFGPYTICKPYLVDTILAPFTMSFKVTRLGNNPF